LSHKVAPDHLLRRSPSGEDLADLLRAWRLWILAAASGALLAALVYWISPPPYRARATVMVDFNLEQAWPNETDRQQFYYLERETRKLEEIAWADSVLSEVARADGLASVSSLRDELLRLGQPGGRWHFTLTARILSEPSAWRRSGRRSSQSRLGGELVQRRTAPTT
jgi:hypothetical protein